MITAALIQSAKTERKLGQDIEDISDRVEALKGQEAGIKQSLAARRGALAEVLGALQRMGLNSAAGGPGKTRGRARLGQERDPARRGGAGSFARKRKRLSPTSPNWRESRRRSKPNGRV